jgi:glutamate dehydrogenase/leucine dehydrogenase
LDPGATQLLRSPLREHRVMVPARMDNDTTTAFEGLRAQHNDARGPFKGVIPFHPSADLDEVRWRC